MFGRTGKKLAVFSLAAFLAFFLTSCAVFHSPEKKPEGKKRSIYGNEMLAALQKGSYRDFVRDFSGDLAASIPEAAFDKLREDLKKNKDTLEKWQFLSTLERGGIYKVDLWKVTFLRTTSDGRRPLERLFFVSSTQLDGKEQIIGFKFDMLF